VHHDPDEVITYLEIGPPIICHVLALICHRGHTGPPPQELVPGVCSPAFEFTPENHSLDLLQGAGGTY